MHRQMIDNNSYNLIMALASNLEALEAYHIYAQDGEQQLWEEAVHHTEEVVKLLQQELHQTLRQGQQMGQGQMSQQMGQMYQSQDYGAGPVNDLSAGPRNASEAEGATDASTAKVIGTNPDGSKLYEGEDQLTYASQVLNPDEPRMGYRSEANEQRY